MGGVEIGNMRCCPGLMIGATYESGAIMGHHKGARLESRKQVLREAGMGLGHLMILLSADPVHNTGDSEIQTPVTQTTQVTVWKNEKFLECPTRIFPVRLSIFLVSYATKVWVI